MRKTPLIIGFVILVVGAVLIPVSQSSKTETTKNYRLIDRLDNFPQGQSMSFDTYLEPYKTYYVHFGGTTGVPGHVHVEITDSHGNVVFQKLITMGENKEFEFGPFLSGGYYKIELGEAIAEAEAYAEISEVITWEKIVHPYAYLLYVGIALVIIGGAFAVLGGMYPIK